jgi:hypothetical protein
LLTAYGKTFFNGRSVFNDAILIWFPERPRDHVAADRSRQQKRTLEIDVQDKVVVVLGQFERLACGG